VSNEDHTIDDIGSARSFLSLSLDNAPDAGRDVTCEEPE
jgi:hypothetical protein